MKRLEAFFVLLVGAAAAIPGVAQMRSFRLPSGAEPLFGFILVTVSAAVVLTAYIAKTRISKLDSRIVLFAAPVLFACIFATFAAQIWVTNLVLVEHSFDESKSDEVVFFPLYLSATQDSLIRSKGGRRKFIQTPPYSPASVADLRTEQNVAGTVVTLVFTYALVVGSTSMLFAVLGFYALASEEDDERQSAKSSSDAAVSSPSTASTAN